MGLLEYERTWWSSKVGLLEYGRTWWSSKVGLYDAPGCGTSTAAVLDVGFGSRGNS